MSQEAANVVLGNLHSEEPLFTPVFAPLILNNHKFNPVTISAEADRKHRVVQLAFKKTYVFTNDALAVLEKCVWRRPEANQ